MRIVLADDHAILRQGLRSLLEVRGTYEIVGEAANGREAIALAEKLCPDIVIMDIAMPELNGLEATYQIRERLPGVKVIILSMYGDEIYLNMAIKAGACAYLLKSTVYEELILSLEAAARGETYLGTGISKVITNKCLHLSPTPEDVDLMEKMTPREREILQFLARGYSRLEIAEALFISPKTVDRHRENMKIKFDIKDEAKLLQLARIMGIVEA